MDSVRRLIRHFVTTRAQARRLFPASLLQKARALIHDGEQRHGAELRLVIEASLHLNCLLRGMTSRSRAKQIFSDYRIWDTEENCGVLVYLNLADRKVEIVADRGVSRTMASAEWSAVCRKMTEGFSTGNFEQGLLTALTDLNLRLQLAVPKHGFRSNQLSDKPLLL